MVLQIIYHRVSRSYLFYLERLWKTTIGGNVDTNLVQACGGGFKTKLQFDMLKGKAVISTNSVSSSCNIISISEVHL